ncbi:zinc finger, CCHC-type containing protein [Tanacetum coccineum]
MATSQNINNSTLGSILTNEKLIGPNFANWHRNLRIALRYEKNLVQLEQPLQPALDPATATQEAIYAYYDFVNAQQEVACLMLATKQELLETVKAFHACIQKDGQSMSSDRLKMKIYLDNLERLGYLMSHELGVATTVLLAIRGGKIQKGKNKPQGAKGKSKGKTKLAYALKSKIHPPPKSDNLTKESICHDCKEVGHWRNCPAYQAKLKKKKNTSVASTSRIFTIELYAFPSKSWVYDTGCDTHISAARILNMVPTKKVERTPYEVWHGKDPKLSYLRVWGCDALMKRDTPGKLDSRSIKCIFVGYLNEMMDYYFYYPLKNKIFVARNAEFFENNLILQEASGSYTLHEASMSDIGLELLQENDTRPSENTSKQHNEVKHMDVNPYSEKVLIRRSKRISQAPNRYGIYVDAEEHELRDLNEPPNYKAALPDPKSSKWLDAMNVEMQSMKDNQVWRLVDLPPDG